LTAPRNDLYKQICKRNNSQDPSELSHGFAVDDSALANSTDKLLCVSSIWSAELDELKQASINAHNLWVLCNRPRQGIINKMRLDANYKYKLAIKHASMNESLEFDDELSNHFYVRI